MKTHYVQLLVALAALGFTSLSYGGATRPVNEDVNQQISSGEADAMRPDPNYVQPSGKGGLGQVVSQARTATVKGYGIQYHGGPIMGTSLAAIPGVYAIYYGNWSSSATPNVIDRFLTDLGGTPYMNINSTYYQIINSINQPYLNNLTFKPRVLVDANDPAYVGTTLSDLQVRGIVTNLISRSVVPLDPDAIYLVITDSSVHESSGFCSTYCGWHTFTTVGTTKVKYGFIGSAAQCPTACAAQWTSSPNDNPEADAMVSIIAHEISEAITDPELNAWYDTRGMENADKCAWTFGKESTGTNGGKYNITINGLNYLIQQNYVNAPLAKGGKVGACSMSYP